MSDVKRYVMGYGADHYWFCEELGEETGETQIVVLATDYATLLAQNERLEKALRFYANNDNYCQLTIAGVSYSDPRTFAPVLQDGGKIALAALPASAGENGNV